MKHARPAQWQRNDHFGSKEYESQVAGWLGHWKISKTSSNTELDFWIPGCFLEVKEKRQPLSARWPLPGCRAEDAFVLDELTVRKALEKFPHAFLLLRDVPLDRTFLAPIWQLACADRVRVDRETSPGFKKGKWVVDMTRFIRLYQPDEELLPKMLAELVATPWKQSPCLLPTFEED